MMCRAHILEEEGWIPRRSHAHIASVVDKVRLCFGGASQVCFESCVRSHEVIISAISRISRAGMNDSSLAGRLATSSAFFHTSNFTLSFARFSSVVDCSSGYKHLVSTCILTVNGGVAMQVELWVDLRHSKPMGRC